MSLNNIHDIVIDTNILMHAHNSSDKFHKSAKIILEYILKSTSIVLLIDDEYKEDESQNSSKIGYEYRKFNPSGTFGYAFLLYMISKGRYKQFAKSDFMHYKKNLHKLIPDDKIDIIFVLATIASDSKLLVSNDYADFSNPVREQLTKKPYKISLQNSDNVAFSNNLDLS